MTTVFFIRSSSESCIHCDVSCVCVGVDSPNLRHSLTLKLKRCRCMYLATHVVFDPIPHIPKNPILKT
jgi:hypothetical protein